MATISTPITPETADRTIKIEAPLQRAIAEGRDRLQTELSRLRGLGILDQDGKLLITELPQDMRPGADRDFGG